MGGNFNSWLINLLFLQGTGMFLQYSHYWIRNLFAYALCSLLQMNDELIHEHAN